MTPEKRERSVKWLTEEVRSLRLAPKVNDAVMREKMAYNRTRPYRHGGKRL